MTISSLPAFVLVLRALRLGSFRLTPYGLCAAVGLLSGMALARAAARRLWLDPEAVWDAGLFAVLSCFVASRLLLVLRDPIAFAHYPLLVLGLPSLTVGGLALAAVMLWVYLRRKKMALLPLLDAFAAPGAMLAACLEIGHWLDGSEVGMPTRTPWGVADPWDASVGRVHPVALYGALAALLLAGLLWGTAPRVRTFGRLAAVALMAGGAIAFGLAMVTQPVPAMVELWLEPGQWVALAAMLCGALLWGLAPAHRGFAVTARKPSLPPEQLATMPTPPLGTKAR